MRITVRQTHAAFTLLEAILAMAVALLLLVALYTSFNLLLKSTDVGRSMVDEANLARGIFNRVTADVAANMPPLDTRWNQTIYYPGGNTTLIGAAATAANNQSSSSTSGSTTSGSTTSGSGTTGSSSSSTTPAMPAGTPYTYNLMVQGSSDSMTIYTLAVPKEEVDAIKLAADNPQPATVTDLRRITYWLVDGKGLARQEIKMVTDINSINTMPPAVDDNDPNTTYFPGNVKSVQFQYFDGSAWQDSWDGTALSTIDNVTPQGPPMAIAITLVIERPGQNAGVRTFRNVVAIQTANNLNPTTTSNSTTTAP